MKVRVMKLMERKTNIHIATLEAFEGSIIVHKVHHNSAGLDDEVPYEMLFDGFEKAQDKDTNLLRSVAGVAMETLFPSLGWNGFKYGRATYREAEKCHSL